jgi:hypothetical protein
MILKGTLFMLHHNEKPKSILATSFLVKDISLELDIDPEAFCLLLNSSGDNLVKQAMREVVQAYLEKAQIEAIAKGQLRQQKARQEGEKLPRTGYVLSKVLYAQALRLQQETFVQQDSESLRQSAAALSKQLLGLADKIRDLQHRLHIDQLEKMQLCFQRAQLLHHTRKILSTVTGSDISDELLTALLLRANNTPLTYHSEETRQAIVDKHLLAYQHAVREASPKDPIYLSQAGLTEPVLRPQAILRIHAAEEIFTSVLFAREMLSILLVTPATVRPPSYASDLSSQQLLAAILLRQHACRLEENTQQMAAVSARLRKNRAELEASAAERVAQESQRERVGNLLQQSLLAEQSGMEIPYTNS